MFLKCKKCTHSCRDKSNQGKVWPHK